MSRMGRGKQPAWVAMLFIAAVLPLSGCSLSELCQPDPQVSKTDVHTIYKQNCAGCHGEQLQGVSGPELTTVGAKFSPDELRTIILEGSRAMPGFQDKLEEGQVVRLVSMLANEK